MARCEVCGNDYDKSFSTEVNGTKLVFDSFECSIQALAPECSRCDRIIGHGVEVTAGFIVAPIARQAVAGRVA